MRVIDLIAKSIDKLGGEIKIIEDWKAEDNQLTALTFDYEIHSEDLD
tara:strand:+ start:82 stop:222 length:141 start_codon:yes stop_codon:yes gene_type:complete